VQVLLATVTRRCKRSYMFNNIYLDHCFNEDQGFSFYKRLEKLGFILDPLTVEHPGKAFCRFIILNSNNPRKKFYLEFANIGKGGKHENRPGLSFGYKNNLERFSQSLAGKIKTKYDHKNYDWKNNSKDRLPGWNFLLFPKSAIRSILVWVTEYEPHVKKFKKIIVPKHPNSVYAIHGISLVLTPAGKIHMESVTGKKLGRKNKMSDGTFLYIKEGKKNKFENIILKCHSLQKLLKFSKEKETIEFEGNTALSIKSKHPNPRMWDLLIFQG